MAVNPLNDEEFTSLHGIHMTEEAFEQLDLELPLALIYAGVF